MKKIIGTLGLAALVIAVGVTVNQFETEDRKLLSGLIFSDLDIDNITSISIASPSGSIEVAPGETAVIQSVYVEAGADSGYISGSDLANSPITFLASPTPDDPPPPPEAPGVVISNNEIQVPDTFTSGDEFFIYEIQIEGATNSPFALSAGSRLEVIPQSADACTSLQTSFILPQGGGLDFPDPSLLPEPATTTSAIDFGDVTPISDISFHYLHPEVASPEDIPQGARTFDIHVEVVSGLPQQAVLVSNNVETGTIFTQIRDEGSGDTEGTRDNFVHLFNTILGVQSPFVASVSTDSTAHLTTKERGTHVNDYYCITNGAGSTCFSGGAIDVGDADVLVVPTSLSNILLQGQTNLVYVDGVGPFEWNSSNESVVELEDFDAQNQGESIITFNPTPLADNPMWDPPAANITLNNCQDEEVEGGEVRRDCDVEVNDLPVTYDISANTYTVEVAIGNEIVEVTNMTGTTLTGNVSGTGEWDHDGGTSFTLEGTVTGNITGTAEGTASGTVSGTIQSPITVQLDIPSIAPDSVSESIIYNNGVLVLVVGDFTANPLTAVSGSFVSNIELIGDEQSSPFTLTHSKMAGNTILSVVDANQCVAAIDVTVSEMKVVLQREDNDTINPGDTFNVYAYVGWDNGEIDYDQNISASGAIEWFSSNPEVATVDQTGIVSVLTDGTTSITARYDTGIPEVGTIESDSLLIEVANVTGLTIGLDESAQAQLSQVDLNEALDLVTINIHDPDVVGSSLIVEGSNVTLDYASDPDTLDNDEQRLADITTQLVTDLTAVNNSAGTAALVVDTLPGMIGVVTLQPQNQSADHDNDGITDTDENGIVDVTSNAASADLTVLPQFTDLADLSAFETYSLMVIAELSDGRTRRLSPTDPNVEWVNTPVNYLNSPSLEAGLIQLGEFVGTSSVSAHYNAVNGSNIISNAITVVVEDGPSIDFIQPIGSGPYLKGARAWFQARISDAEGGINSLASIQTYLVSSNFDTYEGIVSDTNSTWFTVETAFENIVAQETEEPEAPTPPAEGETEGEESAEGEGSSGETETPSEGSMDAGPVFNFFDIPVDIPVSNNLLNGAYKLVFSLGDNEGNFSHYVLPISIGDIIFGDITGDGVTGMIDVIAIFKIINGTLTPTATQANAADLNNDGVINLADLILAFQLAIT